VEEANKTKELTRVADRLIGDRATLLTLWQTIAENFYPERASFTTIRDKGEEFADHLTTSYPLLARRELGNSLSSMLRPRSQQWFYTQTGYEELEDIDGREWLEYANMIQRRAMYDKDSGFVRATKEGDNDFVTFGQCVISTVMNYSTMTLSYRCHHLRDMAWSEDAAGNVNKVVRKWQPTARELLANKTLDKHTKIEEIFDKDPDAKIECRHIVMESEEYEATCRSMKSESYKRVPQPYVSIYVDVDNGKVMQERGSWTKIYTIPRWQTVSDSQYSYSPCTTIALPDARLMQAVALTLLEAGENFVRPPMVAVEDAIRDDVQLFSGGITWVDSAYDERLGDVLRPLTQDKGGFNIGFNMQEEMRKSISEAFFLNKLNLPDTGSRRMTEYEVSQRIQEYVRSALPLLEPAEHDYNQDICQTSFSLMLRNGGYGPLENIPPSIDLENIRFSFESPIHQAEERLKGQTFLQAKGLLVEALALDPSSANALDIKVALRDALKGVQTPAKWLRTEEEIEGLEIQEEQNARAQELLGTLGQGAAVAEQIGKAGQALQQIEGEQ